MVSFEDFQQRVTALLAEMADVCRGCGRDPQSVRLLPVTKTHPAAIANYVQRVGIGVVGENRVQEALEKMTAADPQLQWELIGHLQSNKAKLAAQHFGCIQSLDSEKLGRALDRAAETEGKALRVLLQVNAGRDPAKFGVEIEDAPELVEKILHLRHLKLDGLMTVAPLAEDRKIAETTFENLRKLRDRLESSFRIQLPELSMGMSGDFAAAIHAGSTQIRVGSRLFGERGAQSL